MIERQSKSVLDAVAAPDGYPSPWEKASEITTNPQDTEATMNGKNEITTNAPTEERTMAGPETSDQQPPKKKRNTMKDVAGKINQLRELAKEGRSREKICETLRITRQGFETLRRKLSDIDKVYYDIPYEKAGRGNKVGKGGILISADKLEAMGAAEIFAKGTQISVLLDGDRILIQRVGAKNLAPSREELRPESLGENMAIGHNHLFGAQLVRG